ncbi:MAG: hypothetical protein CL609_14315 [Anaerolineaceae bacterium]|nr:hypothetical protein [Anaerolineaceae bacterium]
MLKILHFSDAHIDMANHGKRDQASGLPIRVLDFLSALDKIINYAIENQVDLVLFTGDTYRDRTPAPTFQREWGKRIKRLSEAKIPTILLVGNHDTSPAFGRAHALQEFETLAIPYVHVISKPVFFTPPDLNDIPVQIIGLPWISRSSFISNAEKETTDLESIYGDMELRYLNFIENCLDESNPDLPILFTAHATIQGADYGGERFVMLGKDQVISGSLVRNPNFDYVALGHIHKPQNLNENAHPPVIYPGSIERVDFGEINDEKFFVVASVEKGKTQIEWVPLNGRRFLDHTIDLRNINKHGFSNESIPTPQQIRTYFEEYLPETDEIADTIARLQLKYPRDWEVLIEDHWIRERYQSALEFQFIRKPIVEARLRLPDDQEISSIPPEQLLKIYLENQSYESEEIEILQALAKEIIQHHDKMEVTE